MGVCFLSSSLPLFSPLLFCWLEHGGIWVSVEANDKWERCQGCPVTHCAYSVGKSINNTQLWVKHECFVVHLTVKESGGFFKGSALVVKSLSRKKKLLPVKVKLKLYHSWKTWHGLHLIKTMKTRYVWNAMNDAQHSRLFSTSSFKNKKTALILSRGTNPAAGDSYGTKFLANLIVFEENPQLNHAFIHLSFHAFVLWLQ